VYLKSYPESSVKVPLSAFNLSGNDIRLSPQSSHVYLDDVNEDVSINLVPPNPNKFVKVIIEGDFLIGVEEQKGASKTMNIYKCFKEIALRHTYEQEADKKNYQPTYECKFIQAIKVNTFVYLAEAFDLPDFLVVRFKSDNSVVYYKVEKYDFTHVEINLRGYDPSYVQMIQMDSSAILILHFKEASSNPIMLFSLDGETLNRLAEPDLEQFMYPGIQATFRFASIERSRTNAIGLSLAICYPELVSFVKFTSQNETFADRKVTTAHDILGGRGLNATSSAICFFDNFIFIANQTGNEVKAFLVDPLNPDFEYEYPLKEFNILLNGITAICDQAKGIAVLQGHLIASENRWKMRVYLNALKASPDKMIIKYIRDKPGLECYFGFTSLYFNEVCMTTAKASNLAISVRMLRVGDPFIHFAGYTKVRVEKLLVRLAKPEVEQMINFKIDLQPKPWRDEFSLEPNSSTRLVTAAYSSNLTHNVTLPLREVFRFSGHVLHFRMLAYNRFSTDPEKTTESFGVKLLDRITQLKTLPRVNEAPSDPSKGFHTFDRVVRHRNVVMSITTQVRYQILSTWVNCYYFDADALTLAIFNQFEVKALCKELDFLIGADPRDPEVSVFNLVLFCQIGNLATVRLLNFTNKTGPIQRSGIVAQVPPRKDTKVQIFRYDGSPNQVSVYLSSNSSSHLLTFNTSSNNSTSIELSSKQKIKMLAIGAESFLLYISRDGQLRYYNHKIDPYGSMQAAALDLKQSNDQKIEDFNCNNREEQNDSHCFVVLDPFYLLTFKLSPGDSSETLQVSELVKQYLVPGTTLHGVYITTDHLIADVLLINRGSDESPVWKNRVLMFYELGSKQGLVWYSLSKVGKYADFDEKVQTFSFKNSSGDVGIFMNSDMNNVSGHFYAFRQEPLLLLRHDSIVHLNSCVLLYNYEAQLRLIPPHVVKDDQNSTLALLIVAAGVGFLALVMLVLCLCSRRKPGHAVYRGTPISPEPAEDLDSSIVAVKDAPIKATRLVLQ